MAVDDGLRGIFRERLPEYMWTSIETGGTGRGIPDSHYLALGGIDGWVEFKATTGHAVTLRPEQVAWLDRRCRLGGRCWIAVRRRTSGGPRSPSADELVLIGGNLARQAKIGGLRDAVVAARSPSWEGGPSRWDWGQIGEWLLSDRWRT